MTSLLQCGSCTFREREKIFEKRCSDLGKLPSARACSSHTSDAFALVNSSTDRNSLESLMQIVANYGVTELNALASLLLKEKQTRKFGYNFYQKVYVRLQGQVKNNYFSNFVVGHILDATKDNIRIVGFNGKNVVCVYAINEKTSSTYYTLNRFMPIREAMIDSKSYIDPELHSVQSNRGKIVSIASPEVSAVLDESPYAKRRLKRAPKDDLVSLVSRMARGVVRPKRVTDEDEIKII